METSGFFDATIVDSVYDRVYVAAQFANYFSCFVGNGVFLGRGQSLQVSASSPAAMSVVLQAGRAWINGYWYSNDTPLTLDLELSDAVNPRIDTIILRYDTSARAIEAKVMTGTPSAAPQPPAIVRNADYYDLKLADIRINPGVITISPSVITDTRPNSAVCGWVSGLIEQVDTTDLFDQFQDALNNFITNESATFAQWSTSQRNAYDTWINGQESSFENWKDTQETNFANWFITNTGTWSTQFNDWFESVQDQMEGDVATQLVQQVTELNSRVDNAEKMLIKGNAFAPLSTQNNELLQTYNGEVILLEWKL